MCTAVLIVWDHATNYPPPPHLGSYTRALLVSQDRRHLLVAPLTLICKRFWSPGIDSAGYVTWRDGTTDRVGVPARQAGNRFLGSLKGLQYGLCFFSMFIKFFLGSSKETNADVPYLEDLLCSLGHVARAGEHKGHRPDRLGHHVQGDLVARVTDTLLARTQINNQPRTSRLFRKIAVIEIKGNGG